MNVEANTVAQPSQNSAHRITRPAVDSTSHTIAGMVRHCQYKRSSARLDSNTYVLRSMTCGTIRVHRSLNHGRAITLCWMANTDSNSRLTSTASAVGAAMPESTVRGTTK